MPIKEPIPWPGKPKLIESDGTATPYFQRIIDAWRQDTASMPDILGLQLQPTLPLTPSAQDQIDNATTQLVPNVPIVQQCPPDPCIPVIGSVEFAGHIPPDAVRDIALLASAMVPMCSPPGEGGDMTAAEVAALGYWAPVTDATDPMDPLFVFDAEGQCVVAFVPTP